MCRHYISHEELASLKVDVPHALCLLEKAFPPSFFVGQVHWVVHLADEIELFGPFGPRWMYPWERMLGRLKHYKKNRAHPEASIAEGQLLSECMFHINSFDSGTREETNHSWREIENVEKRLTLQGVGVPYVFRSERETKQAHMYILQNSVELSSWRDKYAEDCEAQQEA